ncbi:MAG: ClbS/DfsB family four-helix bundle protein [Planctomycetota bacterium]
MPKPTNKLQLISASEDGYATLHAVIDSLSRECQRAEFPFQHRDRNIRDVLGHLHAWQEMFFLWHDIGMSGQKPEMPAAGYSWKTTPQLNRVIWERYQDMPLDLVRDKLHDTHSRLQSLIEGYGDDELFAKRRYAWTGSTSLGVYLISATSSHYQWAIKLIRKFAKAVASTN